MFQLTPYEEYVTRLYVNAVGDNYDKFLKDLFTILGNVPDMTYGINVLLLLKRALDKRNIPYENDVPHEFTTDDNGSLENVDA